MTNENNTQFINFPMAVMAMQALSAHYALLGFHVSTSVCKDGGSVECTIFHDSQVEIYPPAGFLFSTSRRMSKDGYSWTSFYFDYAF